MRNGKYAARRSSGTKVFSLMLAVLLLVGCSVGATLAWLTATTGEVTNTFTVGKVNITLQEHQYDATSNTLGNTLVENNSYKLIPGQNMPKDPFVTVTGGSETCWLFVRIDETNNEIANDHEGTDRVVDYSINFAADGTEWQSLTLDDEDHEDNGISIYYRKVDANTVDQTFNVLAPNGGCETRGHENGCVTVSSDVTSGWTTTPVLKFTAAAIQYDGFAPTGEETDADAALRAFGNLPDDFKSKTNLNTPAPVEPET